MTAGFDLGRFEKAQAPVYGAVVEELKAGRKRSHWMWFIFPQLAGLGRSETAQRYAIASLDEAMAYLAHPVLGERLRECSGLVLGAGERSIHDIFGSPDDMKFHSSMTLFAQAGKSDTVFQECLCKFFDGEPDPQTLALLRP
ncbi:MAG: DUF1810 domain-containing protein [Telluria sp.]